MRFTQFLSSPRLGQFVAGALTLATSVGLLAAPASAQQVFADEFNSGSFNTGTWGVYQSWQSLQRTQFGLSPSMGSQSGVSYARLPLRTYNSTYNASAPRTQGSEIYSKQYFKVGTGIEFEARLRSVNLPRGVVLGLYTYSEKGVWPSGYLKEEIDFEILTNKPTNQYWSNVWNDWNSRYGSNDGVHNSDQIISVSGMNYNNWTTYKTRWYPDRVEWYVNGILTRTSKVAVPDDAMSVHFNLWNADSSWGTAYDAAMQPTNNASRNVEGYMDVDYVRVNRLPAPTKGTWSDGDGLTANYYPNTTLTGTPVTRVDPRLFHDWKNYSPDINIPNDNYSARWSGAIASPFTENVTLTLRAD
ncbi:glycosyl hydrolase family protein, partial [bacterium]